MSKTAVAIPPTSLGRVDLISSRQNAGISPAPPPLGSGLRPTRARGDLRPTSFRPWRPSCDPSSARTRSVMGGVVIVVSRLVHHPQHFWTTGFQEPPRKDQRQCEEHDVQPSRVI